MKELYRFDTVMEMLDPIKGGYRCVFYDAKVVDRFPKGRKTRVILRIDDVLELQCGLQSNGDGRYFSMIGRGRLEGHTYELGQPISVVVYEDPNQLGVELPEVLVELIAQDDLLAELRISLELERAAGERVAGRMVDAIKPSTPTLDEALLLDLLRLKL